MYFSQIRLQALVQIWRWTFKQVLYSAEYHLHLTVFLWEHQDKTKLIEMQTGVIVTQHCYQIICHRKL